MKRWLHIPGDTEVARGVLPPCLHSMHLHDHVFNSRPSDDHAQLIGRLKHTTFCNLPSCCLDQSSSLSGFNTVQKPLGLCVCVRLGAVLPVMAPTDAGNAAAPLESTTTSQKRSSVVGELLIQPLPPAPKSLAGSNLLKGGNFKVTVNNKAGYLCHLSLEATWEQLLPEDIFSIFTYPGD